MIAVGKSILERTARINVGGLMVEYGGGGHAEAGSRQVDDDKADAVPGEIASSPTPDPCSQGITAVASISSLAPSSTKPPT